jgi:hypothetical protein
VSLADLVDNKAAVAATPPAFGSDTSPAATAEPGTDTDTSPAATGEELGRCRSGHPARRQHVAPT